MPMPEIEYDPSIYSKVSWVGLVSTLDGPDPDEFPDKDGLTGSIIFKPSSPLLRFPTAVPQFTLALTNRQVNVQDAQVDEQGRKYVYLEASSPFSEPSNFTWTATFVLAYKGVPIKVPDTKFQTSPGVDVDLTDWIGFSDSVPPVLPPEGNPALEAITDAIASHSMQISGIQQTLQEMDDEMADFEAIMQGGTAGQVLTQSSNGLPTWSNPASGIPSGGVEGQVLTKTDDGTGWKKATPGISIGGSGTEPSPGSDDSETVAIGWGAKAYQRDVAIGLSAETNLNGFGIAIGAFSKAGERGLAIGRETSTLSRYASAAIGYGASATKDNQIVLGTLGQVVTVPGKLEIGSGVAMVTLFTVIEGGKAVLKAQFATGSPVAIETEP
ncbi:hypothetical protein GMA7_4 [Gordonia phage GMA7]|uniref:Uncharacterized protein n=1 Tax=Gordonia phage GMA7 TaxID=1647286 RepID=A0A0K0N718_9CAUD|nr:hypothetical protein AU104_gp004 [Gordonia phage GMA7]AKJ72441.1 hypothetical protein GMA7_4 [Gordonia phage GMA7]